MFKHIVLFALDESKFASKKELDKHLNELKSALELLPSKIDCLTSLRVVFNENPDEEFHFMLEAVLPSVDKLSCYAQHPEHVSLAKDLVKPYLKSRACVDFYEK